MSKANKIDELIALDPDFIKGEASFMFPNGDTYEGEYCAHRSGVVWREGNGTYTTQDNQIYKGRWKDDLLVDTEDVDVNYPSGDQYFGRIVKNKYTGPGIYILKNKMSLLCNFLGNRPTGEICLVDITGREWHGIAEETEALLLPEHIYFNNINEDRGKGQVRSEPSEKDVSKSSSEKNGSEQLSMVQESKDDEHMKKMERKIFSKCFKTPSDLRFEDDDWYKNYVEFKKKHDVIMNKINAQGIESLEDDQRDWCQKYKNFKTRYFEIMDARKQNKRKLSEYKLFELFNSKEFKTSSVGVPVFYPTGKYNILREITFKEVQDFEQDRSRFSNDYILGGHGGPWKPTFTSPAPTTERESPLKRLR
ncbi:hypothetical protein NQ317_014873 [Molorchus minor]|uniref:MORN repeat-containing protein 5 n=1 Tax=Molorchus minor TaxID=1323400 RepID=A0ABQ9JRV1_9CUCU|nr:hypothetical protein NQ317_014873 [Molorchus minor]